MRELTNLELKILQIVSYNKGLNNHQIIVSFTEPISFNSVYHSIKILEALNLVTAFKSKKCLFWTISELGKAVLKEELAKKSEISEKVSKKESKKTHTGKIA